MPLNLPQAKKSSCKTAQAQKDAITPETTATKGSAIGVRPLLTCSKKTAITIAQVKIDLHVLRFIHGSLPILIFPRSCRRARAWISAGGGMPAYHFIAEQSNDITSGLLAQPPWTRAFAEDDIDLHSDYAKRVENSRLI